jgi:hypothetical protein
MKTRILTSTSGTSPLAAFPLTNPTLAISIKHTISTYSTKPNNTTPSRPPLHVKLTTGCRLLGSLIGSASFAKQYFNKQLNQVQQCISLMTTAISDPQIRLQYSSNASSKNYHKYLEAMSYTSTTYPIPLQFGPTGTALLPPPPTKSLNPSLQHF